VTIGNEEVPEVAGKQGESDRLVFRKHHARISANNETRYFRVIFHTAGPVTTFPHLNSRAYIASKIRVNDPDCHEGNTR